jgi:hypothetical protein
MYYPKSQITPNLYTNGNEFVYADSKQSYSGYYFKISTGKYFTGRNQDDRPNVELIINTFGDTLQIDPQIDSTQENATTNNYTTNIPYSTITVDYNNTTQNRYSTILETPIYNPVLPTQQDYQNGEFRRLFCKKTNEVIYIEINQDTFDKLVAKDPQILWSLYQPFNITWQLTGDKQHVARINKNSVELVSFRNKFPRLEEYLKFDYTKYYNQLGTTTSGSYINGVNQGYVLDNRDGRGNRVFNSQDDSGSVRRDNSTSR